MFESNPALNVPEFSVSQLSMAIKRNVEESFSYVRVRGEISGYKKAPSGHAYFNLKDNDAVIAAICWKNSCNNLAFAMEDGIEIICHGRITTYQLQSKYQIIVDHIEPAGQGALMAMLEKRKAKLAQEGLFDLARKKPIPFMPQIIGVVTSPTGAVIQDILHRIEDRFPCRVLVWPVLVQGDKAAEQIAGAITGFNNFADPNCEYRHLRPDVIIVARGGGSLEDLWPFNEEIVVRAAALSKIPLISAVGHETDVTLIDFAADLRAPTPTAAAEMAVPVKKELQLKLSAINDRLIGAIDKFVNDKLQVLHNLSRAMPRYDFVLNDKEQRFDNINLRLANLLPQYLEQKKNQLQIIYGKLKSPKNLIDLKEVTVNNLYSRINNAMQNYLINVQNKLALQSKLFDSYHYKNVLARGFVLVRKDNGQLVKEKANLNPSETLKLEFIDGEIEVACK